ncbi:MAG: hypothetical protein EVA21_05675 [Alphaproteobacteria bacterium]|nr:MAG: hypothetical protein EVA21_05675 [Alphaproteobacteria bacterium]
MEKLNSTDNSYICEYCFIVNNISEAQFFINRFNLKPKKKYNLFPIFSNQKKDIWLAINQDTISPTVIPIYLNNCANANEQTTWIFFSFSFLSNLNSPHFFIIDEIIDSSSKNKLYPSVTCLKKFQKKNALSKEQTSHNQEFITLTNIYEIYKTLEKLVNKALIFVTTLSMPEKYKLLDFDKKIIKSEQKKYITEIMNLSHEMKITIFPISYVLNFYKKIEKEFKFSAYEQNVLKNLLKKFNPNDLKHNLEFIKKLKNGKLVINHLKQKLL